jgi:hypothetical protein
MPLTDVIPSQRQSAAIILAFAAGVAVGANWPQIKRSLGPLMAVAGDKLADVYSVVAEAFGEQKEAFQDARAAGRHRGRSKPGAEQELLAGLATLLKCKRRTAAKPARKRAAGRARKGRAGTTRATTNGVSESTRSRTIAAG